MIRVCCQVSKPQVLQHINLPIPCNIGPYTWKLTSWGAWTLENSNSLGMYSSRDSLQTSKMVFRVGPAIATLILCTSLGGPIINVVPVSTIAVQPFWHNPCAPSIATLDIWINQYSGVITGALQDTRIQVGSPNTICALFTNNKSKGAAVLNTVHEKLEHTKRITCAHHPKLNGKLKTHVFHSDNSNLKGHCIWSKTKLLDTSGYKSRHRVLTLATCLETLTKHALQQNASRQLHQERFHLLPFEIDPDWSKTRKRDLPGLVELHCWMEELHRQQQALGMPYPVRHRIISVDRTKRKICGMISQRIKCSYQDTIKFTVRKSLSRLDNCFSKRRVRDLDSTPCQGIFA